MGTGEFRNSDDNLIEPVSAHAHGLGRDNVDVAQGEPAPMHLGSDEAYASQAKMQTPWEYFVYALKHGFTTYNGISLTLLLFFVDAPHARAVASCTTVGIAISFTAAYVLDPMSFSRIAQRLGISLPAFHVANLLVHILPCALVLTWASAPVTLIHGVTAAHIHLGWGAWATSCRMTLDDIYVSLPPELWYSLWAIAAAAELFIVPTIERSSLSSADAGYVHSDALTMRAR